jgi:hypothetical protein
MDYASQDEQIDDFRYDLGEVVYVQGTHWWSSEKEWIDKPWRVKVVDRWYDDDSITPFWYEVEAIDEPPKHRKKDCIIVHESEIQRYEQEYGPRS